jgi:L-iditol 2-dehydrogenase
MLVEPQKILIQHVEIPHPGKGEVQIQVKRCGVCGSDLTIFKGLHPFCPPPVVMGHEFSGIVSELGEGVDDIPLGQRVTVLPHLTCGSCDMCLQKRSNLCEEVKCIGGQSNGAQAEYVCLGREMVYAIPDSMTIEDAAMVEPACVGYHGSKRSGLKPEDVVLILGAGPIGMFTMQGCKAQGCKTVLIADYDEWRLGLAMRLGADETINLRKETLEAAQDRILGGPRKIDVFFDCVGGKGDVLDTIISIARRATKIVVIGVQSDGCLVQRLPLIVEHELTIMGSNMYDAQDYCEMLDLMGKGIVRTTGMVTHRVKFEDIVKVFDFATNRKESFYKVMIQMD